MEVAAMKHMASNFAKLDKFEGVNFRRWQKNMHFLLSSMSVVYVLTTPIPEDGGDDATVEQIRKRAKWDNDDYVCRGLILNEAKYMAEDASSKKFLVDNFTNYKMTDSRPVMEQYNELLGILKRFTQHKMNMDEAIQVSCIIEKIPSSWKDFKHTLKHLKEELTLVELGSHLRIEESLRMQDSYKPKGNNVVGPSVVNMDDDVAWWVDSGATVHVCKDRCWFKTYESLNDGSILHMGNESTALVHGRGCVDLKFSSGNIVSLLNIVNDNIASAFMSTSKLNDSIIWHARLGHVHFKRMQDMSKDGLILAFDMDTEKCKTCMLNKITKNLFQNVKRETEVLELIHSDLFDLHATPSLGNKKYFVTFIDDASRTVVRLPDPKLKTLGERGIECIFFGYAEHSKAFRFYVIGPNDSVLINSIIESRDAIFDENRLSSVPRPILRIHNGTEDIGGLVVLEEVTEDVVQQPEPELRKSKRNRTPKDFGHEFQLYLIKRTMDEDVAFWKEAINDEMDSIMGNNTWMLADLPPDFKVDFGPTPFCFFQSWLELDGFNDLVVQTWAHDGIVEASGFISFKKKLQNLKRVIRDWVISKKVDSNKLKREHQARLAAIDTKVDQGCANEEDFINRRDSTKILDDILSLESKDLAQKAKIKWAIEGDENTNFFHGTLKKKRRQLAINGILKNGEWIEEPGRVNNEFFKHFSKRFQRLNGIQPTLNVDMPNMLSPTQRDSLEIQFSRDEIKRAVWDCDGDRAPGPDGFTFKFIKTFWDLIKDDVVRFVNEFFSTGLISKGCNSSFIALIPKVPNAKFVNDFHPISLIRCQYKIIGKLLANRLGSVIGSCISFEQSAFIKGRNILDGPLILNEVIAWYRKHKKELMVFKVDFEKAFDSLSARSSVLVNGSPTSEFDIYRGLRQGDPISPFLFILAMEGLHMLTHKAEAMGIFKGATFGGDIDERKMSWVRWNKCLASKDLGGLGIGRLSKASLGLMDASMIILLAALATALGECGDQPLKTLFPRIYMLDSDRSCLVMNRIPFYDVNSFLRRQPRGGIEMAQLSELQAKIEHVTLSDHGDSWLWTLDSSGFSMASVQYLVNSKTLDTAPNATRWIRHIPIKVNIFIWRLMLNKLPSRVSVSMSTPVFVDPEISTQADGAQSPRVPVPFPEDPYEAIRQAYLVETETPESPHTVYEIHAIGFHRTTFTPDHPLTHASPTLVPILRRTTRMAVRVPPAMSPGLSASIAEVAAMSDSAFRKRFRSSYESSPSSSPPDLPLRKHYQEDEDPAAEDEDPAAGDEGLATGDEGPGMRVESLGLGGDAAVPEGQQRATPVVETAVVEMQEGLIHDNTVRLGELSPDLFERYDSDIGELFTSISTGVVGRGEACAVGLAKIVDSMRRGHEPRGDA
ncbi:zinc finger, CCHC-type containing protein [Tanacetum coccineum]